MVQGVVSKLIPSLGANPTHMEVIVAVMTLVETYSSLSGTEKQTFAIQALQAVMHEADTKAKDLPISLHEREVLHILLANKRAIRNVIDVVAQLTKHVHAINVPKKKKWFAFFDAWRGKGNVRRPRDVTDETPDNK